VEGIQYSGSSLKLSAMTYTFRCDNKKCNKSIVWLMSKYHESGSFARCKYCKSGTLKLIQNIDSSLLLSSAVSSTSVSPTPPFSQGEENV